MDKWILSRLNTTVKAVDDNLDQPTRCPRRPAPCQDFVDELSNWYVRRSRDRFWGQADERMTASPPTMTLYTALVTTGQGSPRP